MIGPAGAILKVDKPTGPTSHDIVDWARRSLEERKVGHTGTLDPFASGLLLLCVGPATRLARYLTGWPKSYEATLRLGVETDTLDRDGRVLATDDEWAATTRHALDAAMAKLRGVQEQVPPAFSAKKVAGERAYERARRGESVELEAKSVTVHRLDVTRFEPPEVDVSLDCSTGTYVRALARDLGAELGTGAHLTALRRTAVGAFAVEGAVAGEALRDEAEIPAEAWLTPSEALSDYPTVSVSEEDAERIRHGQALRRPDSRPLETVVIRSGEALVAMGRIEDDRLRPTRVFPA